MVGDLDGGGSTLSMLNVHMFSLAGRIFGVSSLSVERASCFSVTKRFVLMWFRCSLCSNGYKMAGMFGL